MNIKGKDAFVEVFGSSAKLRRELDRKGGACRGILECHITGRAYLTHPRAQDLPALAEAGWMRLALDEMESEVSVLAGHHRFSPEAAKVFGVATAFRLNYRSLKLVQVLDRASRLSAAAAAAETGAGAPAPVTGASEKEPRNK